METKQSQGITLALFNYMVYESLKNPQYENCEVLNPDGELMFRCCYKKANWYLDRNLGVKIKDNPLVIRLNFYT